MSVVRHSLFVVNHGRMRRLREILQNLALALFSSLLFLGLLEAVARRLEPPAPEIADYL